MVSAGSANPAQASGLGKRGFRWLVGGLVLNVLALVGWSVGGSAEPGSVLQIVAFIVAASVQGCAVIMLVCATVFGIRALVLKARPPVWALLAALSIPVALVIGLVQLMIVFAILG